MLGQRRAFHGKPSSQMRRITFLRPAALTRPLSEYELGIPLTDVMPVNSTLAVTARDRFVVAFDRQELLDRMAIFRDLTISDEEIRARFFQNTRSPRYAAGDTRGWKLSAARRRMANDPDWKRHVRPCLYRPFDQRWIYWVDWMVDWPRTDVNRHFVVGNNLGLIARRQMLPTQPCNYFWVSRTIPIDGVIRSDNRGSESAFPLFLAGNRDAERDEVVEVGCAVRSQQPLTANFSTQFVKMMAQSLRLTWRIEPSLASANTFGPLDLFYYIYAQFHSAEYRLRYADWLRIDFPRRLPAWQRRTVLANEPAWRSLGRGAYRNRGQSLRSYGNRAVSRPRDRTGFSKVPRQSHSFVKRNRDW